MVKDTEIAPAPESPLDYYLDDLRRARDASWDEIWEVAEQLEDTEELIDAAQLGDGFRLLESANDKENLVGVPFVIFDWKHIDSKKFVGRRFTSMVLKTRHPIAKLGDQQNFRVNDGAIGKGSITETLFKLRANGFTGWIRCTKGLRRSTYDAMEPAIDEKTGAPLVDGNGNPIMRKVLDPQTGQPVPGRSFYLDLSV